MLTVGSHGSKNHCIDHPKRELLYLFDEKLRQVAVLDRYDSSLKIKDNQGWWLSGVKVSQNLISEPILYDFRRESNGMATYKISPCPPKMAGKEAFLEAIKKLSKTLGHS